MSRLFRKNSAPSSHEDNAEHWISTSDLMTGLMMVFMFVSIAFMRHVNEERDQVKSIAVAYESTQNNIYAALMDEFKEDLSNLNIESAILCRGRSERVTAPLNLSTKKGLKGRI